MQKFAMAEVGTRVDIEWSCPTCTYINKAGSFKCSVCGTLKGTATRQVKYHLSTLEQQYMSETLQSNRIQNARALARLQVPQSHSSSSSTSQPSPSPNSIPSSFFAPPPASSQPKEDSSINGGLCKRKQKFRMSTRPSNQFKLLQTSKWPRLKNINRSYSIRSQKITVNNITVTITEYPLLYPDSE